MVGPGAAVALYSGQRESAERAVARINQSNIAAMYATVVGNDTGNISAENSPGKLPQASPSPLSKARRELNRTESAGKSTNTALAT